MFGIGGIEFLIIAIVTVLVVGPNELPRVLYNAGKAFAKMREYTSSITKGFDDIAREGELQDIISKANEAGDVNMSFREEQQRALEARKAAGGDYIEDNFKDESGGIDGEDFDEEGAYNDLKG